MKRLLLGMATAAVVLLVVYLFKEKKGEEARLGADPAPIQTQTINVSKLVVTEGHFTEVFSYIDTQKCFMDWFPFDKRILTIVDTDVAVSHDLHRMVFEISEEQRKVIIRSLSEAEVRTYPEMKYYDIAQSQINPFKAEDVPRIEKRVNKVLEKKIAVSNLESNAQDRLISELSTPIFATRAVGQTLEHSSTPIDNEETIKKLANQPICQLIAENESISKYENH